MDYHAGSDCISTYVHTDTDDSETSVISDKGLVLAKAMVVYQTSSDNVDEIPVEESIHQHDQNLGGSIPVFVDVNKTR